MTTKLLIPALAILLCLPALAAAQHSVSGTVTYDGPPIKRVPIRMDADPKCAEMLEGKRVLSGDRLVSEHGGLQNVFVWIEDGGELAGPAASEQPITIVQEHCWYQPRVQGIRVKQTLSIVNADPTLHNVRSLAKSNRPFNLGQPPDTAPREKFFHLPEEAVKFKCDVHPWMEAYLFVMDHAFFATSDASGAFRIDGVPAGKHTLVAWHEKLGRREIEVEVSGDTKDADLTFSGE